MGEGAYRLLRNTVTAESLGQIALKGRADPLAMYRLLGVIDGASSGRRRASPLVGRERELGSLSNAYEGICLDRAARLVTVIGAAGVGKSRLVDEFLDSLPDDATVVTGRCLPYGDGITFWPLKEVIGQAAGLNESEGSDEARGRVRALVGSAPDADLIVDRVAETVGLTDAIPEHKGTSWAVRRLFEELARDRPLVVVIDDIQWAEVTLLELVEEIVKELRESPALVLCMARPELLDTHLEWAAGDDHASSITLEPLSDTESGELLANLLGGAPVEEEARARIVEASDGLPLFVEEMVAKLVEEGALTVDNGRWVASDLARITAPATIHALLAARLDRLEPALRLVLERGAIEGQVFHRAAVEYLSPEPDRAGVELESRSSCCETSSSPRPPSSPAKTRSASTTFCSGTSPTSPCARRSGRPCTSGSPTGSTSSRASGRASSTRSPATTSSRRTATARSSRPTAQTGSSVHVRASASAPLASGHTRAATGRAPRASSPAAWR